MKTIIDYSEIDKLCIPVIKLCNEKLGMETLFCCQGKSLNDGPNDHHSLHPYILFMDSESTLSKLKQLIKYQYENKLSHWKLTYAPYNGIDRWSLTYNPSKSIILSRFHMSMVSIVWKELYDALVKLNEN